MPSHKLSRIHGALGLLRKLLWPLAEGALYWLPDTGPAQPLSALDWPHIQPSAGREKYLDASCNSEASGIFWNNTSSGQPQTTDILGFGTGATSWKTVTRSMKNCKG